MDIIRKQTWLLLCGGMELALAKAAFGGPTSAACGEEQFSTLHASINLTREDTMMDIGSRIKQITFLGPNIFPPPDAERDMALLCDHYEERSLLL